MRVLKEMASNIANIPEDRIYHQFVSSYALEWCVDRVEGWDEKHKLQMRDGWWVFTAVVDQNTVVFRIKDNWGERHAKYVDGILHRQAQDKTLVMIVDPYSKPAAAFTKGLVVVTVIAIVATTEYVIIGSLGLAPAMFVLVMSIVAAPFVYMWVQPALSGEGFVANSPVIDRIRKSLGDTEFLLTV